MFCQQCGAEIPNDSVYCPNCGRNGIGEMASTSPYPNAPYAGPEIKSYLTHNIVAIFFCWPLAIPGIINAVGVNSAIGEGNYQLAQEKSEKARSWFGWALGLGIVGIIIRIILTAARASM
ncbi:MAG: CD225/dispanin family protein [Thermoguttaceae bacterium]|nr:CD225/dispanin family protein [Thermoguttaceae bacterium]